MANHKWISILLDGSVDTNKIFKLIDESYIAVSRKWIKNYQNFLQNI